MYSLVARQSQPPPQFRCRQLLSDMVTLTGGGGGGVWEPVKEKKKRRSHCHSPFSPQSPSRSLKRDSDACRGGNTNSKSHLFSLS